VYVLPDDLSERLEAVDAPLPDPGRLRHAAVMALILPQGERRPHEDPRLLFIKRSAGLRTHAGQLAFPGGKPEPQDESLLHTALRESEEEVGLLPKGTQILGRLEAVPTPTGFMIVPYVGWAPPAWTPRPTSYEVQALLTPRFSELADPAIHRLTGRGVWEGHHYELHEFAVANPPLWGATARMVWDLLQRLHR
jgi:8-oxo-dGTP pyrophosphatase MutT (NUDIX family)